MRFITPHRGLTVTLLEAIEEPDPYHPGRHIIKKPGFVASFRGSDYTESERSFALSRFKFRGIPLDESLTQHVDPSYMIGTYDTGLVDWERIYRPYGFDTPEEMKSFIEDQLVKAAGTDFDKVDTPDPVPPWKGYDKLRAVKRIVELVQETGSDVEDVIQYERLTKNRDEVIEALEGLLSPSEPEATVISA